MVRQNLWARVGKNVAKLQNGDQAEAEADRRRPQPEFIWHPSFCAKFGFCQTWSVDISPSCCHVDVLAKPCCGPRGHGPKAGKQTGTPPLENLRSTSPAESTWSLWCRQVLLWDWQRSAPPPSPAIYLVDYKLQSNYDDSHTTIMILTTQSQLAPSRR